MEKWININDEVLINKDNICVVDIEKNTDDELYHIDISNYDYRVLYSLRNLTESDARDIFMKIKIFLTENDDSILFINYKHKEDISNSDIDYISKSDTIKENNYNNY